MAWVMADHHEFIAFSSQASLSAEGITDRYMDQFVKSATTVVNT